MSSERGAERREGGETRVNHYGSEPEVYNAFSQPEVQCAVDVADLPEVFRHAVWCSRLPRDNPDVAKSMLIAMYESAEEFLRHLRSYGRVADVLTDMIMVSDLVRTVSPTLLLQLADRKGLLFGFKPYEGVQAPLAFAIRSGDGVYVIRTRKTKVSIAVDEDDEDDATQRRFTIYDLMPDCARVSERRGKRTYECNLVSGVIWLKNLVDAYIIKDTVTNQRIFVAKVRGPDGTIEKYAWDANDDVTKLLKNIPVSRNMTGLNLFVTLVNETRQAYPTGFLYMNNRIVWNPGSENVELRVFGSKEEARENLELYLDQLNKFAEHFENSLIIYQIGALFTAYTLYQPYRLLMSNADTPVPVVFGLPSLNKTTLLSYHIKSLGVPVESVGIPLIVEGTYVTRQLPRIIAFLTESTLPAVIDDVVFNENLVEIVLQLGAASYIAKSMVRANPQGPGTKDKLPILRMLFLVTNAKSEGEIYGEVAKALGRLTNANDARIAALFNRRLVMINMNKAGFYGDVDLRKLMSSFKEYPSLLGIVEYAVRNADDVVAAMRQELLELQGKYVNFLYFAYAFWKFLVPLSIDGVDTSPLYRAVEELARARERSESVIRMEIEMERKKTDVESDEELLKKAVFEFVEEKGKWQRLSDLLDWLVYHQQESGVFFTRPRSNDDYIQIKKRVVSLLCSSSVEELSDCPSFNYFISKEDADYIDRMLREKVCVVYVRKNALGNRIPSSSRFMGREATPRRGYGYVYVFSLDEFLRVLLGPPPSGEEEQQPQQGQSQQGQAQQEGQQQQVGGGSQSQQVQQVDCEKLCSEKVPPGPYWQLLYDDCVKKCTLSGGQA